MGTRASEVSSRGEDGPGVVRPKPELTKNDGDYHDELKSLLVKNVLLMIIGGFVITTAIAIVGLIANTGRLSSDTGNDLLTNDMATQRRNSCVTELGSESDKYTIDVLAAVLNRLAVLDGIDPETGEPLPRRTNEEGRPVIDLDHQGELAEEYTKIGLEASKKAEVSAEKLLQPKLNELCGDPVGLSDSN